MDEGEATADRPVLRVIPNEQTDLNGPVCD